MSMPWLQGTAGLARQSPALPLRDTSTRWRRRYRKASAITRMASWVSADVYWNKGHEKTPMRWQWHHANRTQQCTGITARSLSLQQRLRHTKSGAADEKSMKIEGQQCDWHKNWVSVKAVFLQGQTGDRIFKYHLTEMIQRMHLLWLGRDNKLKAPRKTEDMSLKMLKCKCSNDGDASLTFSGVFLASGNSLSSRRSQRWRNCWTMELSGLMIWKPVMLAPPEKTLSRLMLEKPWE